VASSEALTDTDLHSSILKAVVPAKVTAPDILAVINSDNKWTKLKDILKKAGTKIGHIYMFKD
jgi:hypothetical protein